MGARVVYLGEKGTLAGLPLSVLGPGPGLSRVGLGLLVSVAHDGPAPWVAWLSPFQLVVSNLGEVPNYSFCWAPDSGC